VHGFAKNKLQLFYKKHRQVKNSDDDRYFNEDRAKPLKDWDGALKNNHGGSNRAE